MPSSSGAGGGGKVSFFLTFQLDSPRLTSEMMDSINFGVNEIVTSCDAALMYTYIHLLNKARSDELGRAIQTLATSHGVKGSHIFGYDSINSTSVERSELIEDHPGFKMLVQHEANGNEHFHRWTARGYSGVNRGFNLLKARLSTRRTPLTSSPTGGAAASQAPMMEEDATSDEDGSTTRGGGDGEAGVPNDHDHNRRNKRQRAVPSSGYELPASIPAYLVQLTADSIASSMSKTIGARADEASAKLRRAEDELEQQRRVAQAALAEVQELRRAKVGVVFCCFVYGGCIFLNASLFCISRRHLLLVRRMLFALAWSVFVPRRLRFRAVRNVSAPRRLSFKDVPNVSAPRRLSLKPVDWKQRLPSISWKRKHWMPSAGWRRRQAR